MFPLGFQSYSHAIYWRKPDKALHRFKNDALLEIFLFKQKNYKVLLWKVRWAAYKLKK